MWIKHYFKHIHTNSLHQKTLSSWSHHYLYFPDEDKRLSAQSHRDRKWGWDSIQAHWPRSLAVSFTTARSLILVFKAKNFWQCNIRHLSLVLESRMRQSLESSILSVGRDAPHRFQDIPLLWHSQTNYMIILLKQEKRKGSEASLLILGSSLMGTRRGRVPKWNCREI